LTLDTYVVLGADIFVVTFASLVIRFTYTRSLHTGICSGANTIIVAFSTIVNWFFFTIADLVANTVVTLIV
jgi:hypothetical protein